MNQRHHDDHPDLPDLLEAIGASAEEEAGFSTLSDDAMVSSVRLRATALRVRRARTRNLAAVATVAAVAAAGVGVTQYVGRVAPTPVPPAQTTPAVAETVPTCGSTFVPPKVEPVRLATASGTTTVTELPQIVVVNDSEVDVVAGFEHDLSYALVQDGVVVGGHTGAPSGYSEARAGTGDVSEVLNLPFEATMCDGAPVPEGVPFQLYVYLDAEVAENSTERQASSYYGPRGVPKVRLWSQAIALTLESGIPLRPTGWADHGLVCADPTAQVTPELQSVAEAAGWPLDITVDPAQEPVPVGAVIRSALQVRLAADPEDETTYVGRYVEAYLVKDGHVVSGRKTTVPGGMWVLSSGRDEVGDAYAEHHGATPLGTLYPELTGTRCQDGAPLEPGDYEVLVVAHAGGPDVDFHVIAPPTTITLVGDGSR